LAFIITILLVINTILFMTDFLPTEFTIVILHFIY